ncbi:FAD-dependent oxidoreductase [Actinocatenispora rupis]|uniref:FAD-dependent oxidoreductase n=1 Tax=Actinocatenispora rupis TaxID=519421 RepID=A0A8J3JB78_9ACTN|nr:FAD-dependent oxidoreductase [Actinocatenispora rupis]GID15227.1 FAD-dependent oxidoreductase [Actinocatenispora rupis]
MKSEQTPVLIVGAGLAGLSTALFLAHHGVRAVVVDRHPGTANQPKARGQSPTIMEAFRRVGVADAITAATPPGRPEMTIVICDAVTGTVMHSYSEAFPDFAALSPMPSGMASQQAAEAAMAARATELGADLRFSTVLESFEQDADGVRAVLRDVSTDERYELTAEYLVGADGNRGGVGSAAGIGTHGRGAFGHTTTVLFRAEELIDIVPDTAVLMYYVQNPALPNESGAFVSTDRPGEYVAGINDDATRTEEETVAAIRTLVGRPDLDVTVLGSNTWEVAHRVADRLTAGRVHLVGDAAHLMPPTGGQGGNTAMLDGMHLAWKLAAVVRGEAGPGLLASHDAEQLPYGQTIADWQFANLFERMHPDQTPDDLPELPTPTIGLFGYRMASGAIVGGAETYGFQEVTPAVPGMRAPHVPLLRDGAPVSPRDLMYDGFVLLTADPGWDEAATKVAERLGIRLDAYRIGAGLTDPDGRFAPAYGVEGGGAVLVRPDGVIGWRTAGAADAAELDGALRTILDR